MTGRATPCSGSARYILELFCGNTWVCDTQLLLLSVLGAQQGSRSPAERRRDVDGIRPFHGLLLASGHDHLRRHMNG
jgi:hypothetical protein